MPQHRPRCEANLKQVISTWAVGKIARWLERVDPPRSGTAPPALPVGGAITWHLRVGGSWRRPPPGMPPWRAAGSGAGSPRGLFDHLSR